MQILGELDSFWEEFSKIELRITSIFSNRFMDIIIDKVSASRKALATSKEVLERLSKCQKDWIFLDRIYSGSDLKRQQNPDLQIYENCTRQISTIYKKIQVKPTISELVKNRQVSDTLNKLETQFNLLLINIRQFLKRKRKVFPRLHLVSDDDMLSLLSKDSGDDTYINRFVHKMFFSVKKIIVHEDGSGTVTGLQGSDNEVLELENSMVSVQNPIEQYLEGTLRAMRAAVHKNILDFF